MPPRVGKDWHLEVEPLIKSLVTMFSENPKSVSQLLEAAIEGGLFDKSQDSYKNDILVTRSRGTLTRFLGFIDSYSGEGAAGPLPAAAMDLLQALSAAGESSAYPTFKANLQELETIGKKMKITTIGSWNEQIPLMRRAHRDIKVSQADSGVVELQANKQTIGEIYRFHTLTGKLSAALP